MKKNLFLLVFLMMAACDPRAGQAPGQNQTACLDFVATVNALPCNSSTPWDPAVVCPPTLDRASGCDISTYYACLNSATRCAGASALDLDGWAACDGLDRCDSPPISGMGGCSRWADWSCTTFGSDCAAECDGESRLHVVCSGTRCDAAVRATSRVIMCEPPTGTGCEKCRSVVEAGCPDSL